MPDSTHLTILIASMFVLAAAVICLIFAVASMAERLIALEQRAQAEQENDKIKQIVQTLPKIRRASQNGFVVIDGVQGRGRELRQ